MATRRERVILDAESNIAGVVARDAAAVKLLQKNLDDLDGTSTRTSRSTDNTSRSIAKTGDSSRRAGADIDRYSGRLRLVADLAATLGPGLIPIGAVGIPAVAGLAAQLGFAGLAGGTAMVAFQGLGDTLKAVNTAALEPTAENLEAARIAMQNLSPAGRDLVRELRSLSDEWQGIRNTASEALLPGVTEALDTLESRIPDIERILDSVGSALGGIASGSATSLASARWSDFFEFLATDAGSALRDMAEAIGAVAHGLSELWMAFDPLNDDFSSWMVDVARGFDSWAEGLSQTEGFAEFVDYIRTNGPLVADAMGSLAEAVIEIVEAAAPLGGPVLRAITGIADAVAMIADSDAGTPIMGAFAALSLFNRAQSVMQSNAVTGWRANISGANGYVQAMNTMRSTAIRGAAGIGMLGLALTDVDDKMGVSKTAMGAMAGLMIGGPWGMAIGAGIGLTQDFTSANEDLDAALEGANQALGSGDLNRLLGERTRLMREFNEVANQDGIGGFFARLDTWASHGLGGFENDMAALNREIGHVQSGAVGGKEALANLLAPTRSVADEFHRAAMTAEEFRQSVSRAFGLLDRRESLRNARQAIRDFNKAMREAPEHMREGSKAYDTVQDALDNIARSSLEAAENMHGMNRVRFLDQQRDSFIDAARQMGLTARQARHLADQLGLLDKSDAKPKVDVDTRPAKQGIDQANLWLVGYGRQHPTSVLDVNNRPAQGGVDQAGFWLADFGRKTATAKVDVDISNVFSAVTTANAALNNIADEIVNVTTVHKGKADGGTIMGRRQPYGDKVLSWLAPGEEVISNRYGQADRHRELLQAINANAYAGGGTVEHRQFSAPRASWGGGSHRVERIVERLPSEFRVSTDLGDIVLTAVDDRIGDHNAANSRPSTTWAGVTRD